MAHRSKVGEVRDDWINQKPPFLRQKALGRRGARQSRDNLESQSQPAAGTVATDKGQQVKMGQGLTVEQLPRST